MLKELGLIDVWRVLHPGQKDYTHFSHPHTSYSIIDYFFVLKTEFFIN